MGFFGSNERVDATPRGSKEKNMGKFGRASAMALSLLALAGCNLEGPKLLHPGNAATQQKRAERFDPYPSPDIGPEVAGSRPRDYQVPRPETTRSRWTTDGARE